LPTGGTNDTDGGTLIIIYADNTQNFTGSFVLADGCQGSTGGAINSNITGFNVCANPSLTEHFMIVGDLQQVGTVDFRFNSLATNFVYPTASQQVWDFVPFNGAAVTVGQNNANYGINTGGDCYALNVAGLYYRTTCSVCPVPASGLTVTALSTPSCPVSNATANVSGGVGPYSYTWTPSGQNSQIATGLTAGTYTVFVRDAPGCKTGSAVVTVSTAASNTINVNSGFYCLGGSVNLTASGAPSYTWSPGIGLNTTIGSNVVANPVATTIYTITSTNTLGCTSFTTTQVTVNPTPTITTNGATVCVGNTINITGNSIVGASYNWVGPNSFSSTNQNPTIAGAIIAMNGVYNLTVTSAAGCTNTAVANVSVVNLPVPLITSNSPVCVTNTLNLIGTGGINYNWFGPNAFTSAIANPTLNNVSILASGIYTLITTAGTCSASTTASIIINALPIPTLTSNSPLCPGNTLSFAGTGGVSYNWSGPSGFNSALQNPSITNVSPTNSGNYTLVVTAANTCSAQISAFVTVNPTPTITTNGATVCVGNTINITSNSIAGATYNWSGPNSFSSTNQNPTITGAITAMNGVYNLTVTSTFGCTNTALSNVSVVNLPVPLISSNSPVCATKTLNLIGTGGINYNWFGPNAFTSAIANPTLNNVSILASGIYTLIATAGTCSASTTASIIINALPIPTLTSNSPLCPGSILNLVGTGGLSYSWSGPSSFNSALQNPSITNVTPINSGNYTVVVTAANTCSAQISASITVNQTPILSVTNTIVCVGQTINLNSTSLAGSSYLWNGVNSFTSSLQNPNLINAQLSMMGAYNLTVTSLVGCTNTAVANVTVVALPVATITSNSPVCVNNILNFQGSGGVNYTWNGPNSFTSISQNPTITNASLLSNGIYTLIASVGSCSSATTASIIINPLPIPIASNSGSVCETKTFSLAASGGNTYVWTGPNTFTTSIQNPILNLVSLVNAGVYSVAVTNTNNCVASAQTTVIININPIVIASGAAVCLGNTANLIASGGASYSWVGPNNFTSTQAIAQINNTNNTSSGIYTVVVTSANTCTSVSSANLAIYQLPTPTVTSNGPICLNKPLNLQGSGGLIYSWSGPNNFVASVSSPSFVVNSMQANGVYNLSVIDVNGCTNTISLLVVVNPLPTGNLISSVSNNCVPFCGNFSLSATSTIQSTSWEISDGETSNASILNKCFTNAGTYSFITKFTDANNCANTASFVINAYPVPVADFYWTPFKPLEKAEEVNFTDATSIGGPATQWNWTFISNTITSTQQNPTYIFENAGVFPVVLVAKNKWGCSDTAIKIITIAEDYGIYIPNAFTPNNDGINDFFQPKGYGIIKFEMTIFDRWGEKLFVTTELAKGWDGSYEGQICKDEVYVYKVNLINSFGKQLTKTGHVTLTK